MPCHKESEFRSTQNTLLIKRMHVPGKQDFAQHTWIISEIYLWADTGCPLKRRQQIHTALKRHYSHFASSPQWMFNLIEISWELAKSAPLGLYQITWNSNNFSSILSFFVNDELCRPLAASWQIANILSSACFKFTVVCLSRICMLSTLTTVRYLVKCGAKATNRGIGWAAMFASFLTIANLLQPIKWSTFEHGPSTVPQRFLASFRKKFFAQSLPAVLK